MNVELLWIDGRFTDSATYAVRALDPAVQSGTGVFETMRLAPGHAICRRRHLARLSRSADIVGVRYDSELVAAGVEAVVAHWPSPAGRLRITLTPEHVIVHAGPLPAAPAAARVVTSPYVRNERSAIAGAKTTSYAENLSAHRLAGADEALLANTTGFLSEGTRSNVFVERDGHLITPPESSGCLAGVTRGLLIELGLALEADLPFSELAAVNEAFLTSSLRVVQPIDSLDGRPLVSTRLTRAAAERVQAFLAANPDPPPA